MVEAYWNIGKEIAKAQGQRAEYGKQLLKYLSEQLTKEFGMVDIGTFIHFGIALYTLHIFILSS